jgi:dTMP kinase
VNPGRLLVLEGIDGCGKSTQIPLLAESLRAAGHDVLVTREPTEGPLGRRIRAMAAADEPVAPEQELAWFVQDRREHVRDVLEPALAAGRLVVSDRYYLSTVAYQGARGLDWRDILEESEREFPAPDLALVLEVDPAVGLARVQGRGQHLDPRFEEADYLGRVAAIFRQLDRPYVVRIEASGDPDSVRARVRDVVSERLGLL